MFEKLSVKAMVTLVFVAAACFFVPHLHLLVLGKVLEGRTFTSDVVWYDPIMARYWLFDALVFTMVGFAIALLWRSRWAVLVAFLFGATYAGWWYGRQTIMFVLPPLWYTYVWTYGAYLVPAVTCAFGAWLYSFLRACVSPRVTRG
jgi:hypothetical protein